MEGFIEFHGKFGPRRTYRDIDMNNEEDRKWLRAKYGLPPGFKAGPTPDPRPIADCTPDDDTEDDDTEDEETGLGSIFCTIADCIPPQGGRHGWRGGRGRRGGGRGRGKGVHKKKRLRRPSR